MDHAKNGNNNFRNLLVKNCSVISLLFNRKKPEVIKNNGTDILAIESSVFASHQSDWNVENESAVV